MTFYIWPPDGKVLYSKLHKFCCARFALLLDIASSSSRHAVMQEVLNKHVHHSECLIEGSRKDALSHYVVRLLCSVDADMTQMMVTAETQLFSYRFSCMTAPELATLLQQLSQVAHLTDKRSCNVAADVHSIIHSVLSAMGIPELIENYLTGSAEAKHLRVTFQCVLPLVARRLVRLELGVALVPCSRLCDLAAILFEKLLTLGVSRARQAFAATVLQDARMRRLYREIKGLFRLRYKRCDPGLQDSQWVHHDEVDQLVDAFPPCMSQLHHSLRNHHRLRHFSRLQYTLFLKELGLPVHEAVHFWRKEYLQPSSCRQGTKHRHSWQKDERRYTYSIRHLYGLEGSRINYRAHSCQYIQDMSLTTGEEGGCPFRHFDRHHLIGLLHQNSLHSDWMFHILHAVNRSDYNTACQQFLYAKHCTSQAQHQIKVTRSQPSKLSTNKRTFCNEFSPYGIDQGRKILYSQSQWGGKHTLARLSSCSQESCHTKYNDHISPHMEKFGDHTSTGQSDRQLNACCDNNSRRRNLLTNQNPGCTESQCYKNTTINHCEPSINTAKKCSLNHVGDDISGLCGCFDKQSTNTLRSPLEFYNSFRLLRQGLDQR